MKQGIAILALTVAMAATLSAGELTFAVPGRANSAPWVAASGNFVAVAWGAMAAGKGDIMIAVSRDGGQSFGAPVRVNADAGEARISGEIAPRVTLQARRNGDPIVTVTWNAKQGQSPSLIKSARSVDGGRTFGDAVVVSSTGAPGDRGWQATAVDGRGTLHTVWLDHRGMAAAKSHDGHKGEHDGVAMAQRSALYYATAGGAERELFKGVCYCCKTAMAAGPNGQLYAAWRHVFANNMRDIAFTVSRDGGATFAPLLRVHEDRWSINGCPDDGPALAVDRAGVVHLVWPTVLHGEDGALLYATSRDGRTFSPPVRVPTRGAPKPSHPQLAVNAAGGVLVAWDEVIAGVRTAAARSVSLRNGRPEFGELIAIADGASSYPVLAATARGWFAAWTTGGPSPTVRATLLR